jgi:hypothetical protein
MPCADPSPSRKHKEYDDRVDSNNRRAARVLCEWCDNQIAQGEELMPLFSSWYKEHKKIDKLREELINTDSWFAALHGKRKKVYEIGTKFNPITWSDQIFKRWNKVYEPAVKALSLAIDKEILREVKKLPEFKHDDQLDVNKYHTGHLGTISGVNVYEAPKRVPYLKPAKETIGQVKNPKKKLKK